jgi:hypothetical protein
VPGNEGNEMNGMQYTRALHSGSCANLIFVDVTTAKQRLDTGNFQFRTELSSSFDPVWLDESGYD